MANEKSIWDQCAEIIGDASFCSNDLPDPSEAPASQTIQTNESASASITEDAGSMVQNTVTDPEASEQTKATEIDSQQITSENTVTPVLPLVTEQINGSLVSSQESMAVAVASEKELSLSSLPEPSEEPAPSAVKEPAVSAASTVSMPTADTSNIPSDISASESPKSQSVQTEEPASAANSETIDQTKTSDIKLQQATTENTVTSVSSPEPSPKNASQETVHSKPRESDACPPASPAEQVGVSRSKTLEPKPTAKNVSSIPVAMPQPQNSSHFKIGLFISVTVMLGGLLFFIGVMLGNRGQNTAEKSDAVSIESKTERNANSLQQGVRNSENSAMKEEKSTSRNTEQAEAVTTLQTTNHQAEAVEFSESESLYISEKSGSVKAYPADSISNYPLYLNAVNQRNSEGTYTAFGTVKSYGYSLCDINQDSIPELVIAYMPGYREDASYLVEVFCINNNQVYSLTQNIYDSFMGLTNKGFITSGGFCPDGSMTFYKYNGSNQISEWDTVSCDLDYNDIMQYSLNEQAGNRSSITEQEFNKVIASYGSEYELSLTPLSNILEENRQENSISPNESHDDPKWEYKDTSNLIAIGKVSTQGAQLNIRTYPSTDSDILIKIPNGTYIGIVELLGDWMYVKYYQDTDSPIYYGYVSSEWVEITKNYNQ